MSKELCEKINFADENVVFDPESQNYKFNDEILKAYCPNKNCDSESLKLSSSFIGLLENFRSIYNEKSEDDKLAQYAILWFSSKISQNPKIKLIRGTMYNILKQNDWFEEHSEFIENRKDTMGIYYLYLNRLYKLLKEICNTITICSNSSNSEECIKSGKKCSEIYHTCIIQFPWKEICNPYCSILSNLKNDYDKLRKHNDKLPIFTIPEGAESCEETCAKKNQELKVKDLEIGTPTEASLPDSSVPPTSINNGNKLPYIAVPLILIPIILGISYKYLTPVWRKKAKRKAMKKIINLSDQKKA
ncbi:CIR protein [Plasmodium chabaudi chabaudi]|uniref:CIR protein n=1 Tax=Plasmodium chabaudi chabaudi TaxID=31271 RepID=A0A1C6WQN6_PLACU|nr:CIR protein [Plasmodium chabaudi chabaudi]